MVRATSQRGAGRLIAAQMQRRREIEAVQAKQLASANSCKPVLHISLPAAPAGEISVDAGKNAATAKPAPPAPFSATPGCTLEPQTGETLAPATAVLEPLRARPSHAGL
jgi:hypothetical protein